MKAQTYETNSEIAIMAEIHIDSADEVEITKAWIEYDNATYAEKRKDMKSIVKIPIDPDIIGEAERENLIEQALLEHKADKAYCHWDEEDFGRNVIESDFLDRRL